jgi:phasin family protein
MNVNINEFIDEQKKGLAELVGNFSKARVAAARSAARESAARIRALNDRVRKLSRSGVRLTAVSQGAAQSLIELQADIVTTALGEAAAQMERMAYTESVRDLARMQADVLQATRERIVADISRTVTVLRDAAGDARKAVASRPAAAPARKRAKKKAAARRRPVARAAARAKVKTKVKTAARRKSTARRAKRKSSRR